MYQAWVVQNFNGVPYNVILGTDFPHVDDAYKQICFYEKHFGKCVRGVIEPAGTEIPTKEIEKETLWEKINKFFE